jgi:hypothetical protein
LKLRYVYKGIMPTAFEIKEMIGNRLLKRTVTPIKNDSEAEDGFVDYELMDAGHDNATLVSSRTSDGLHMPVIDIDRQCMLVPSSQDGNFHLYINVRMTEEEYMELLEVMTRVGIVQRGYWLYSQKRHASYVRYPGVTKYNEAERIKDAKQ